MHIVIYKASSRLQSCCCCFCCGAHEFLISMSFVLFLFFIATAAAAAVPFNFSSPADSFNLWANGCLCFLVMQRTVPHTYTHTHTRPRTAVVDPHQLASFEFPKGPQFHFVLGSSRYCGKCWLQFSNRAQY